MSIEIWNYRFGKVVVVNLNFDGTVTTVLANFLPIAGNHFVFPSTMFSWNTCAQVRVCKCGFVFERFLKIQHDFQRDCLTEDVHVGVPFCQEIWDQLNVDIGKFLLCGCTRHKPSVASLIKRLPDEDDPSPTIMESMNMSLRCLPGHIICPGRHLGGNSLLRLNGKPAVDDEGTIIELKPEFNNGLLM